MKDLPYNTEFCTEIYLPYFSFKTFYGWLASEDGWGGISSSMRAYVRLKPGMIVNEIEESMFGFVKKHRPASKNVHHYRLQPLSDVHFDARYGGAMSMRTIIALTTIGFF